MVVCKFFQQGNCRFGQNCRYDHIYGSKYSYNSNAQPSQSAPAGPTTVTDEQLIQQVQTDVQAALRGGQWLLSSYAPFKEKPAFPGINDLSFEEARLFIYEAKANNTVEQAVAFMTNLFKEARTKYEHLLLKNINLIRILRSIYNGENISNAFGSSQDNSSFSNSAATSVFRSAAQTSPFAQSNQASSIFSQNTSPSVFSQNATPSIFAQNTATDPAKSVFAQANQQGPFNTNQSSSMFSNQINQQMNAQPNLFGPRTDTAAKSIFAQASQSVFASPTQNVPVNPASIFASASQSSFTQQQSSPFSQNQSSVFQKPETQTSGFGVFQQANTTSDMNIYSKMEDLSADDIEAYNSTDFRMGFVPELPPPHSLCF